MYFGDGLQQAYLLYYKLIAYLFVSMRKFTKPLREPTDNSSAIFQQAKKRFHYQPSSKSQKPFLIKPKDNTHALMQLKDDFSSVKDAKQENNQINESSWIAKLVNVMHQDSSEELKPTKSLQQRRTEVNIQFSESQPQLSCNQKGAMVHYENKQISKKGMSVIKASVHTKKNSINKERRYENASSNHKRSTKKDENQEPAPSFLNTITTRKNTAKKSKSSVNIKINRSSSNLSRNEFIHERHAIDKKSLQNLISGKKLFYQTNRLKDSFNADEQYGQSTKEIDSKRHRYEQMIIAETGTKKLSESLNQMQQIKSSNPNVFEKEISFDQIRQKIDIILEDSIKSPLFRDKKDSRLISKEEQPKEMKRKVFGSIKKNIINNDIIEPVKNVRQEIKEMKQRQIVFIPKGKENDIVTERQQQKLIQKYYKYSTYAAPEAGTLGLCRDFTKKYSYLNDRQFNHSENNNYQPTTTFVPSKEPSSHHSQTKIQQNKNKIRLQNHQIQSNIAKLQQKYKYNTDKHKISTQETVLNIQNQRSAPLNVQNQRYVPVLTFIQPIKQVRTVRGNAKSHQLSKDVYLQQNSDLRLFQGIKAPESDITTPYYQQSPQYDAQKMYNQKVVSKQKSIVPSKFTYLTSNQKSTSQTTTNYSPSTNYNVQNKNIQTKYNRQTTYSPPPTKHIQPTYNPPTTPNTQIPLHSTFQREKKPILEPSSDLMIDKLNNKLNQYISYHHLAKQLQPRQWDENEPTHRKMQLNFNQLKKHCQFHKP